jgi:hypothetical protein
MQLADFHSRAIYVGFKAVHFFLGGVSWLVVLQRLSQVKTYVSGFNLI